MSAEQHQEFFIFTLVTGEVGEAVELEVRKLKAQNLQLKIQNSEPRITVVANHLFPQYSLDCLSCCLTYLPTEGVSRIYCRLQTLCLIIAQKAFTQTLIFFIAYMSLRLSGLAFVKQAP